MRRRTARRTESDEQTCPRRSHIDVVPLIAAFVERAQAISHARRRGVCCFASVPPVTGSDVSQSDDRVDMPP